MSTPTRPARRPARADKPQTRYLRTQRGRTIDSGWHLAGFGPEPNFFRRDLNRSGSDLRTTGMSLLDVWRARVAGWLTRSVVVAAPALLLVLGAGSPASADVTITSAEATQGDAAELQFHVTNDSATTSITTVQMILPVDNPIAEVYPLSVDDWAPSIAMRDLDRPVQAIHSGRQLTETTASVTWTAVPGRELPPGRTAVLRLEVGPLPAVQRLAIGIVVGNSDGTVVRYTRPLAADQSGSASAELPAPVLVLKPAPATEAQADPLVAESGIDTGPSYPLWTLGILAVVAILVIFGVFDRRHRGAAKGTRSLRSPIEETPEKGRVIVGAERGST